MQLRDNSQIVIYHDHLKATGPKSNQPIWLPFAGDVMELSDRLRWNKAEGGEKEDEGWAQSI